jgi:hypothetical protein
MRARVIGLTLVWLLAAPEGLVAGGQPAPAPPLELPAIGWTCPMHREVFQHEAGQCPLCGMTLVPTRLEPAWSCPLHAAILQDEPGRCPIDGRTLMPVTVEVSWVCPVHADLVQLEPGRCPVGGEALVRKRTPRPHEDHTPKHGGIFFMAPDNWHHLEGVYPEPGVFRLYLYDNYSRPLPATVARGRAVVREEPDEGGRVREVQAVPLVPSPDGRYLEARVGLLPLPAEITAKLTFQDDQPGATTSGEEARFDFVFAALSSEPAEGSSAGGDRSGSSEPTLVAPTEPPGGFVPPSVEIPEQAGEIAQAILRRHAAIGELVQQGRIDQIFVPALEAKDLGLALDERVDQLNEADRVAVRLAIKQLVRAAWLLDWYGDLGRRDQVGDAYRLFAEAAETIRRAYRVP